jgi:hypothetical protein
MIYGSFYTRLKTKVCSELFVNGSGHSRDGSNVMLMLPSLQMIDGVRLAWYFEIMMEEPMEVRHDGMTIA